MFGLLDRDRGPGRIRTGRLGRLKGIAQPDDAQERGAPVGDPREVVDIPAQRLLHLVEGADHHDQPPEGQAPGEVTGRRDQNRRNQREPAVARGHPGQSREVAGQLSHHGHDAIDRVIEDPALLRFAAMERDALGILADADQGKAELRLAGITGGIERDQRAADPPGEPGTAERVAERAPDHVARNHEAAIADHEDDLGRQHPEHADEADQKQRGLQQADPEIGRQLDQMAGVLLDALVGIGPDLAGLRQEIGALWRQPAVEQVVSEPFPQPDLEHLLQPGLPDHQHQQSADDQSEHEKLQAERCQVAVLDRIEEAALPRVEPDLAHRIGADHQDDPGRQQAQPAPIRRPCKRGQQRAQLGAHAVVSSRGYRGPGGAATDGVLVQIAHVAHPLTRALWR